MLLITIWNSVHVKYEHSPQYVTVVQKINKNIIGPLKVKSYTQRQTTNNRKHAHNIKHTFLYTLAYVQSSNTHRHIKDESRSKPHNKENTHPMVVYSYMFHPITACRLDAPQQHMHQQTRKHLRKTLLYLSFLCSCSLFSFFNFPLSSRTVRNDGKNRGKWMK